MQHTIFRQYDIRGKVGEELILDNVYDLACAIAYYFKQEKPDIKTIAIGMDGRADSLFIKQQICNALQKSGLDVIFVGVCPSPVLYFALYQHPVEGGLMITASHNPKEYNGIKMCLGVDSVWGEDIKKIQNFYTQKKRIISKHKGSYTERLLIPTYVDWLVEHFYQLKQCALPIVFDCANAVGGLVLPLLVEKMGWHTNVQLLYTDLDPTFPHHEADPVVIENMQDVKHVLQTTAAQVGIGFDGDADRMCAMTKAGELMAGDKLLGIFAYSMMPANQHMGVVFNVTASSALTEVLARGNGVAHMVATGHPIIKNKMHETGSLLAGEVSCHFFFNDRYFGYDDGIYAALRLIEIMHTTGKSLEELASIFPKKYNTREYRLACLEENKDAIVNAVKTYFEQYKDTHLITIDGVRVNRLYGWGVVRAAHTQPVISVRFESDTKEGLTHIKEDFKEILSKYLSYEVLAQLEM